MVYLQKYTDQELLDPARDLDETLEDILFELAENFFQINNAYCREKYLKTEDFFWNFPACDDYDDVIRPLVPLGRETIRLNYARDRSTSVKKLVLHRFLEIRRQVQAILRQTQP